MNLSGQAVIVVQRPANYFFGGSRSFIVWIDGKRAGKVRRGVAGEFAVEPGEHVISVSMDWFRSRPLPVAAGPGSRTELMIGARAGINLKLFLPILASALIAPLLLGGVRATAGIADANWWLHWLVLTGIYAAIFGGYVVATSLFFRDYWAVWTLGPAGTETL